MFFSFWKVSTAQTATLSLEPFFPSRTCRFAAQIAFSKDITKQKLFGDFVKLFYDTFDIINSTKTNLCHWIRRFLIFKQKSSRRFAPKTLKQQSQFVGSFVIVSNEWTNDASCSLRLGDDDEGEMIMRLRCLWKQNDGIVFFGAYSLFCISASRQK